MKIIIRIAGNMLALYAAQYFVSGFLVNGGWKGLLIAGLALALLNMLAKPVLKLITLPFIALSMGLFALVINGVILWGASILLPDFITIAGFSALIWATLVVSLVNMLTHIS